MKRFLKTPFPSGRTGLPGSIALAFVGLGALGFLFAQGPLDPPPGAPTPTMKSLDQIEPRTPIDATHTPGDASHQFRITSAGSYYLTGPVTGVSGQNGISVQASDVTIDLGGFPLKGVAGSLDGVRVETGFKRLTLRNGTVADWEGDGVDEVDGGATDGIFEGIHSAGNGGDGLRLGNRATVRACAVSDNTVYGLTVDGSATLIATTATGNGGSGLYFGAGLALECTASANGEAGIESFDEPVLLKKCVAFNNSGTGIRGPSGAKIAECVARGNDSGIDAGSFSAVTDCTVKTNSTGIQADGYSQIARNDCSQNSDAGIRANGPLNLIDSNQTLDGGTGILTLENSIHNLIRRNTSGGNSTNNYDISADNRHGPVVDITSSGSSAVSGNSAADTTTTTHPWANFATETPAASF